MQTATCIARAKLPFLIMEGHFARSSKDTLDTFVGELPAAIEPEAV